MRPNSNLSSSSGSLPTGNPGNPHFYREYLERLSVVSSGSVWGIAIGHLGHSKGLTGSALFTLSDQIAHKYSVVQDLLDAYPKTNIVLAGHSVGAHICSELMRSLDHSRVTAVFGLYPTMLHIGKSSDSPFIHAIMHAILLSDIAQR